MLGRLKNEKKKHRKEQEQGKIKENKKRKHNQKEESTSLCGVTRLSVCLSSRLLSAALSSRIGPFSRLRPIRAHLVGHRLAGRGAGDTHTRTHPPFLYSWVLPGLPLLSFLAMLALPQPFLFGSGPGPPRPKGQPRSQEGGANNDPKGQH